MPFIFDKILSCNYVCTSSLQISSVKTKKDKIFDDDEWMTRCRDSQVCSFMKLVSFINVNHKSSIFDDFVDANKNID